jgi:hypothetical protein
VMCHDLAALGAGDGATWASMVWGLLSVSGGGRARTSEAGETPEHSSDFKWLYCSNSAITAPSVQGVWRSHAAGGPMRNSWRAGMVRCTRCLAVSMLRPLQFAHEYYPERSYWNLSQTPDTFGLADHYAATLPHSGTSSPYPHPTQHVCPSHLGQRK